MTKLEAGLFAPTIVRTVQYCVANPGTGSIRLLKCAVNVL